MDWVGLLDPVFVGRIASLAGEVVGVFAVHLHIRPRGRADRSQRCRVRLGEQSLFDDVISLVRGRWAPLIGDPAYDVLESLEGL